MVKGQGFVSPRQLQSPITGSVPHIRREQPFQVISPHLFGRSGGFHISLDLTQWEEGKQHGKYSREAGHKARWVPGM